VLAFEANGPVYKLLARNVTANGLSGVEPYLAAVDDVDGITEFPVTAHFGRKDNYGALNRDVTAGVARRRVRRCRLDSVAPANTRLIKIDVEGTELAVLLGARKIVRDLRPILLIEVRMSPSPETDRIIRSLAAIGYHMMWFLSPFATPMAPRRPQEFVTFDRMILALPTKMPLQGWNLPRIDPIDPWTNADWLHHLARYGVKKFAVKH
jgi:FkbM family methyltransferase